MSVDNAIGLALTWQALGEDEQAQDALAKMTRLLDDIGSEAPLPVLRSCQARLALARGDDDEAGRWLRLIRNHHAPMMPSYIEIPDVTRARWLLNQDTQTSREHAGALVEDLRRQAARRGNALSRIRAESVHALWQQAGDDTEGATSIDAAAARGAQSLDVALRSASGARARCLSANHRATVDGAAIAARG
jgi:hypothetical protein